MLLGCILDQSGGCTFDAAGCKDSDQHQFVRRGNEFRWRGSDMTNRCSRRTSSHLHQCWTCQSLTYNHQEHAKEESCNQNRRNGVRSANVWSQYSPRHTGTSSNFRFSCNVMFISFTINALTCCLDAFWINLVHVHLMLRDERTPTDTNSSRETTFGGAMAT